MSATFVGDAIVVVANIETTNGVIHAIDQVVLPN
ncbi:MAG: fasciclin domain-containing protein [Pseudomonadota bacterium]|nr:fasciclin domain-containing protein [Pseudomonadota bacterium]|tara:strand:+ start:342 stop:443 length:102 start_codon:yes stop_codon:yes gene_type:complete